MQKNEQSRASLVRNYILNNLENRTFVSGDRLPGVKRIASELGVSHAVVQNVIDTLVSEGIIYTVPRGGSYVQNNWRKRVLHTNITTFEIDRPWVSELQKLLNDYIPEMRLTEQFEESTFEIQTTTTVQARHDEYMDLSSLFDECFPDKSDFDLTPFKSFYFDDKLAGLPIMFSPRVMFFNPGILEEGGCAMPDRNWTWSDFIKIIKQLRRTVAPERIMSLANEPYYWMNIVARNGGCLINHQLPDPVVIDSEQTIRGLEMFRELERLVNVVEEPATTSFFVKKDIAFCIGGRECVPHFYNNDWFEWHAIPLPAIPGGVDTSMQITDLLCIRKNCTDMNTAREIIKLFMSERFQNILGDLKYGIPIRKSAAVRSLDITDSRDAMFLEESSKVMREYNLNSPLLFNMVKQGITMCLMSDIDIRPMITDLANSLRTYLEINDNTWSKKYIQQNLEVTNV